MSCNTEIFADKAAKWFVCSRTEVKVRTSQRGSLLALYPENYMRWPVAIYQRGGSIFNINRIFGRSASTDFHNFWYSK